MIYSREDLYMTLDYLHVVNQPFVAKEAFIRACEPEAKEVFIRASEPEAVSW